MTLDVSGALSPQYPEIPWGVSAFPSDSYKYSVKRGEAWPVYLSLFPFLSYGGHKTPSHFIRLESVIEEGLNGKKSFDNNDGHRHPFLSLVSSGDIASTPLVVDWSLFTEGRGHAF